MIPGRSSNIPKYRPAQASAKAEFRSRRNEEDVLVACLDERHPRLKKIRREHEQSPQIFAAEARIYYQALGEDTEHVETVVCGAIVIQRSDPNGGRVQGSGTVPRNAA